MGNQKERRRKMESKRNQNYRKYDHGETDVWMLKCYNPHKMFRSDCDNSCAIRIIKKVPLTHPPTYHVRKIYLTSQAASQCTKGVVRVTTKSSGSDEKQDGGSTRNYQKQQKARWGRLPKTEATKMGVDYPKRKHLRSDILSQGDRWATRKKEEE